MGERLLFGYRTTRKPKKVTVNGEDFEVVYRKKRMSHDGVLNEGLLFYGEKRIEVWEKSWQDTLLHEIIHVAIIQADLEWVFSGDLEEQLVVCLEKTLARHVTF